MSSISLVQNKKSNTKVAAFSILSLAFSAVTVGAIAGANSTPTLAETPKTVDFACTESIQTFTAPIAGKYKIETWGAQGGDDLLSYGDILGGRGGYASGVTSLSAGQTVYVYVGCQGEPAGAYGDDIDNGDDGYDGYYSSGAGGGGGASEVRLSNSKSTPSSASERLVVAGGGGGVSIDNCYIATRTTGGYGGGGGGLGSDCYEEVNGKDGTALAGGNGGSGGSNGGGGGGASVAGGGGGGNGDKSTITYPSAGGTGGFGGPTAPTQFGLGGVNSDGEGGAGGGGGGWIGGGGGGDNETNWNETYPRGFDGTANGGGAAAGFDFPECNGQGGGDAFGGLGAYSTELGKLAGNGGWNGGGGGGSCGGGAGGAGGGYYGGGGGGGYAGAGGGGSSYVSASLTNAVIINGNLAMTSPTGVSEIGNTGNGYARISWYGLDTPDVGIGMTSNDSTFMAALAAVLGVSIFGVIFARRKIGNL